MARPEQTTHAAERLHRLQRRLGDLHVPALLRLRDAVEQVLAKERVSTRDVDALIRLAE